MILLGIGALILVVLAVLYLFNVWGFKDKVLSWFDTSENMTVEHVTQTQLGAKNLVKVVSDLSSNLTEETFEKHEGTMPKYLGLDYHVDEVGKTCAADLHKRVVSKLYNTLAQHEYHSEQLYGDVLYDMQVYIDDALADKMYRKRYGY